MNSPFHDHQSRNLILDFYYLSSIFLSLFIFSILLLLPFIFFYSPTTGWSPLDGHRPAVGTSSSSSYPIILIHRCQGGPAHTHRSSSRLVAGHVVSCRQSCHDCRACRNGRHGCGFNVGNHPPCTGAPGGPRTFFPAAVGLDGAAAFLDPAVLPEWPCFAVRSPRWTSAVFTSSSRRRRLLPPPGRLTASSSRCSLPTETPTHGPADNASDLGIVVVIYVHSLWKKPLHTPPIFLNATSPLVVLLVLRPTWTWSFPLEPSADGWMVDECTCGACPRPLRGLRPEDLRRRRNTAPVERWRRPRTDCRGRDRSRGCCRGRPRT